jgi:hypothetical protein
VTGHHHAPGQAETAWTRYLDREHAARESYLSVVARAHQEYLTGPWPDRDAYNVVELQAWHTYYHAGRSAWNVYRAELATPPEPPRPKPAARAPEDFDGATWPPPSAGHPYPVFTPRPEDDL